MLVYGGTWYRVRSAGVRAKLFAPTSTGLRLTIGPEALNPKREIPSCSEEIPISVLEENGDSAGPLVDGQTLNPKPYTL